MRGLSLRYQLLASQPAGLPDNAPVILACDMDLLISEDSRAETAGGTLLRLPRLADLAAGATDDIADSATQIADPWHLVATGDGVSAHAVSLDSALMDRVAKATGMKRARWREVAAQLSDRDQALLGRGMQIARWYATSRYCSACATPTEFADGEAVARCPSCGHVQYPRHAPAMIVAVIRDQKILLGRSPRFRGAFHSVLAGFVEPGESVEECIHREVREEAGIEVKNTRYFGSQSWPMPHSLMLAYIAEWAAGEISIDDDELEHAEWYAADELPNVPGEVSIAGRMIRWFRENHR